MTVLECLRTPSPGGTAEWLNSGPLSPRRAAEQDYAAYPAPKQPGAGGVMTGKVAIITGASQGIGTALVAAYRGRGWAVVASARTIKPPEDPDVLTVAGDIADPATADRITGAALERFGRIDITGEILHIDGGQIAGH